jgi:hypothetical protein
MAQIGKNGTQSAVSRDSSVKRNRAMNHRLAFIGLLLGFSVALQAGPRTSTNYSITTDSVDQAGVRTTSTNYTNDGSAGSVLGTSTVTSPAEFAKNGYIGQLYEVTGLALTSSSSTLNETTGTVQLGASQTLDDSSSLAVSASTVTWSVQSGPIASITTGGLATAGTVYQDTGAVVKGIFGGNSATFNLTVLNVNHDDFGSYSGDGIDDAWQVQHFGLNGGQAAAPTAISDGSGLTNLFKFTAGLVPGDPTSTFNLTVQPVPGQPTQMNVVFSPSLTDRHYTIQSSTDLVHWANVTGSFSGNGTTQTVTDPSAGGGQKFYRVQVTYP